MRSGSSLSEQRTLFRRTNSRTAPGLRLFCFHLRSRHFCGVECRIWSCYTSAGQRASPLSIMPQCTQAESQYHKIERTEKEKLIAHDVQKCPGVFRPYGVIPHKEPYHTGSDDMAHPPPMLRRRSSSPKAISSVAERGRHIGSNKKCSSHTQSRLTERNLPHGTAFRQQHQTEDVALIVAFLPISRNTRGTNAVDGLRTRNVDDGICFERSSLPYHTELPGSHCTSDAIVCSGFSSEGMKVLPVKFVVDR